MWVNGVTVFNFLDGSSFSMAQGKDVGGGTVVSTAIHLSAASNENGPMAAGSIVSAYAIFGAVFASTTATATSADWPTSLAGTSITVKDSQGVSRPAALYYVSPTQINYRLPADSAAGFATAIIANGPASYTTNLNITATYPNLFMADANSAASGYITRIRNGQATNEPLTAQGIDLGPATDQVYLVLYGSGLGAAKTATATAGGAEAAISYAGPQGIYSGLDQYNVLIPRSLAGKGKAEIVITAAGRPSNAVSVNIR